MRIFGFGQKAAMAGSSPVASPAEASDPRFAESARRDLLRRIGDFLLGHRLDVSARNLVISHVAFSGENLRLGRQIATREFEHQPITQDWLEGIIFGDPEFADRQAEVEKIASKLDRSLENFSNTARQASTATATYSNELSEHAHAIKSLGENRDDIGSLIELTRAMIKRTQQLEADMCRSESEIASLRKSVARARRDADLDHLTGLSNRRAFEAVFANEYRDARASVEALAIALCDIDSFKLINDSHGHDTGDRVIQEIADTFSRISNDKCHVARHGGEEFVILFRGMTPEQAKERLDSVRENFSKRKFVNRESHLPIGQITFSGGVANVFGFTEPRAALAAADKALYEAKQHGRNQICLAA